MLARLVNSNPEPTRLASIRLWLSASDHLPFDVRRACVRSALSSGCRRRRIPPVLLNGYGMVELGGLAMMGVDLSLLPGSGDCASRAAVRVAWLTRMAARWQPE